eukprot:7754-Chlamydomonas_euryale.AAC.2
MRGRGVSAISASDGCTAAVTAAGDLYTWGCGHAGQAGHGAPRQQLRPKRLRAFGAGVRVHQVGRTKRWRTPGTRPRGGQAQVERGWGVNWCADWEGRRVQVGCTRSAFGQLDGAQIGRSAQCRSRAAPGAHMCAGWRSRHRS